MPIKYHDDSKKEINAYMWFKLLDKHGKLIQDYPNSACYGSITGTINKNTAVIVVYRKKSSVPYNDDHIVRYIYDLNDMGFPVSIVKDPKFPDTLYLHVYTENYKSKTHMFSTLTLLRLLWESGMNKVPEHYLQMMDEDPSGDKLDKLQRAHKVKGTYVSGGHAVTFPGNGGNIDKNTLFERFNKGVGVFSSGGLGINIAWKGPESCPMVAICKDCLYKRSHGIYP